MLKPEEDAFGQEMADFFAGKEVIEVVERDDGYLDPGKYGPAIYFKPYAEWPEVEKKAIAYARGRVLDVGCGAGRVSLYLQEQGHDAVGIDNSPLAIKICRQRGLKKARVMSITQVSKKLGVFDSIVMFGNNFGLFGNTERARWLLRKFRNLTSADARIIAQSLDPYKTDAPEHLWYHKFNKKRGRLGGQIRLRIRHRMYKTPWFDYLLVSQKEMKAILAGTGWKVVEFIESDPGFFGGFYFAIIEKE